MSHEGNDKIIDAMADNIPQATATPFGGGRYQDRRTFMQGDYVRISGLNNVSNLEYLAGFKAYIYDVDWSVPRAVALPTLRLEVRGGWDMTLVNDPHATPEEGLVTRWKQGEDGGQVELILRQTYADRVEEGN